MQDRIENPSDFKELEAIRRFFIYGNNDFREKLQVLVAGRFPGRFHGFLTNERPPSRRCPSCQFSLRYWENVVPLLGEGDCVMVTQRNPQIEARLHENKVRVVLPFNLWSTYVTYEMPTFLHFCTTYLDGSGTALDIGGNTGLTGATLAGFCEHVHIFEANPEMKRVIENTNVGKPNVSIHMNAVSRQSGTVSIYPVGVNNTSMVAKNKTDPVEVPCITLDDFCRDHDIAPKAIKIDVEGVDGEVILGAARIIEAHKPYLFLEHPLVNAGAYETDLTCAEQALAFLREHYDLLAYPTMDMLVPAEALGSDLDVFHTAFKALPTNIAAVPKTN
ncbi:FkbM family methyltransferase [Sulfidibacter corallicola]|uniref:FkbM family methyltransferase n=1 Tax=Sulfidibacter corallicola TaxID=2818388 RepID=A0A8A4TU42_SULCO|nr:FkbM family methyltransferase [Sulfidibacter corallicola]QTD53486.1 FkbM family methyltransferase [Sulfidibacter corallicola]